MSRQGYSTRQEKISVAINELYIGDFNGNKNIKVGFKYLISQNYGHLTQRALSQLGESGYKLFLENFINYRDGYILCVNTPFYLNNFKSSSSAFSITGSLIFTAVKMPEQFLDQEGQLSSNYEYGEKITVLFKYENSKNVNTNSSSGLIGKNPTPLPSNYISNIPSSASRQILMARDMNTKGRSLKTQSVAGGGGIGIGIWS